MRSDALLPAPKVAKLLPLLASPHDGEVVATARAIGRVLATSGLDWHALASTLTGSAMCAPRHSWSAMSRSQRLDTLHRLLGSDGLTSVKQRAVLDELIGEVLS
jgi:hypothetical protein